MKAERNRKIIYWLLPLAGILFCLWYVKSATCDVVYSDYIRLVNSYLPDGCSLSTPHRRWRFSHTKGRIRCLQAEEANI